MKRFVIVLLFYAATLSVAGTISAEQQPFKVTTTLDGKAQLPHRIRWAISIGLPAAQVGSFAFQIDGKTRWIGNRLPAVYADGNGFLVTSWLAPGKHTFTVKVYAKDGRRVTHTSSARTVAPPPPPTALAGTWQRTIDPSGGPRLTPGHLAPAGVYRITFERRWIQDHLPGKFDRAHSGNTGEGVILDSDWNPGATTFHVQGDVVSFAPNFHVNQETGNSWCFPGGPGANYRWTVTGSSLQLAPVGGNDPCRIRGFIWTGTWNRAG
jgi:hypothetical protein